MFFLLTYFDVQQEESFFSELSAVCCRVSFRDIVAAFDLSMGQFFLSYSKLGWSPTVNLWVLLEEFFFTDYTIFTKNSNC